MKIYNKYIGLFLLSLGLFSCDNEEVYPPIEGEVLPTVALAADGVDFSKYVAIGASFSAGFTDGALFIASQENSFPNILASKFAMANGGAFNQPMMNDNIGGFGIGSTTLQPPRFFFNAAAGGPERLDAVPTTNPFTSIAGDYNNYGIPGAKSFHLTFPGYGVANPYFGRMTSNPAGNSVIGDAAGALPTFFTLSEVGGNDVLGYALDGGTGADQTGNPNAASYGPEDITDPGLFGVVLDGMIAALTANPNTKGVVGNVPYITSLSNFTTVPYNPVPLDQATADLVNQGYAPYNAGIQQAFAFLVANTPMTQAMADAEIAKRTVTFAAGQNAVVLVDEDLTDLEALSPLFAGLKQYRQATTDDLLLLAGSAFIGTTVGGNPLLINGVSVPLADKWVLTPEEQAGINTATDAYNAKISAAVGANPNLVMVDLNAILVEASTAGIQFDQYNMNTDLVFGGLISLDGIHLTSRGYALMANKILEAIDTGFGTNFGDATDGLAKADNYPTNYSPALR